MPSSEDDARDHLARLTQAYREQRGELDSLKAFVDALHDLLGAVRQPPSATAVLETLSQSIDKTRLAARASASSLLAVDEDTSELVFIITHGEVPHHRLGWRRIPVTHGVAGWVATHQRPAIVNSPDMDQRFYSALDQELSFETRSIVAVPLLDGARTLGVIELLNKEGGGLFTSRDQYLLSLTSHLASALLLTLVQDLSGRLPGSAERPACPRTAPTSR